MAEDIPGLVISVTPYVDGTENILLVAFTSMYDTEMSFSGSGSALDANGEIIGDTFVYVDGLKNGNTVYSEIYCGDKMPSGVVRWEECQVRESDGRKYIPWEIDYSVSGNPKDRELTIDYSFYASKDEATVPGSVSFVLVDENGFVLTTKEDYVSDELAAGEKYTGQVTIYGEPEVLAACRNIAVFAESTVSTY